MARDFNTSYLVPYRGNVASQKIAFCDAQAVVLDFPWRTYGLDLGTSRASYVNPGVEFDLAQPPAVPLPNIQSVYIDNTSCDSPVYLRADDTNHVVTCPDGSSGYFPLFTGGQHFTLYIESVALPYEKQQRTRVFLLNKAVPPQVDFQFAEFIPAGQISGDQAFAANVQGDQYAFSTEAYSVATTGTFQNGETIIPGVADTTLVITNVFIACNNLKSGSERQCAVLLVHNGREIFRQRFFARPYEVNNQTGTFVQSQNHPLNLSGMAVRLDGRYSVSILSRMLPPTSPQPGYTGAATFVPDVHVVYARIRNPTI